VDSNELAIVDIEKMMATVRAGDEEEVRMLRTLARERTKTVMVADARSSRSMAYLAPVREIDSVDAPLA
jgi:hypothetical protein